MKKREDVENDELENFEEAIRAVNTALQPTKLPDSINKILSDPKCSTLDNKSEEFWIMARSLKDFIDNSEQKLLPVRGSIPDMFSDSDRYIKLSNIYRNKANQDAEIVYKAVQTHLEAIGKSPVIFFIIRIYYFKSDFLELTESQCSGVNPSKSAGMGIKIHENIFLISC